MSSEEIRMESGPTAEAPNAGAAAEDRTNADAGAKPAEPNLADELREFGRQIEGLFQEARNSPRGKEIVAQLTSAWRDVEKGINSTINSAQAADVKGTVTGTAQYASDEVQGGLARGLRSINLWMAQKAREAEERRKKREEEMSKAATSGTAEDEVKDRFDEAPVFGQGVQVPAAPVHVTSEPNVPNADNPIADRFDDQNIAFGESGEVK